MGAPTVYYYDDPGAPVLTNIQDAFYQILMACLVNGYGSKPAAGWSVVHDQWAAHGHASFTNNTESGVLGLVRNTTANFGPYLYIAEAMVDYQTAVSARSGMRSNINPATLATASLQGRQRAHGPAWQRWVCVADDQGAWLFFGDSDARLFDNLYGGQLSSSSYRPLYLGAFDSFFGGGGRIAAQLGNFIIVGGVGDSFGAGDWYNAGASHPCTIFHGSNGVLANDGSIVTLHPFHLNLASVVPGRLVDDSFTRFYLSSVQIVDMTQALDYRVAIGELRFLKASWELAVSGSNTAGRSNAQRILPSGRCLRDVVLIDGVAHLVAAMGANAYALISLAEADWA